MPHAEVPGDLTVDRHRVAQSARMAHVHRSGEIVGDRTIPVQPPIVQHPGHIAIDLRRVWFFDNERSVEPASDLLETALVRVIPKGSGIDRIELVSEGLSGGDRHLRKIRDPVHCIGQAQPVPMDGGFLVEPVCDVDAQALALSHPQFRARNLAVISPGRRFGAGNRRQARKAWCRVQRKTAGLRRGQPGCANRRGRRAACQ